MLDDGRGGGGAAAEAHPPLPNVAANKHVTTTAMAAMPTRERVMDVMFRVMATVSFGLYAIPMRRP
jgi:hypothetical protein